MWRDVLLIIGFILAVCAYFGLTPQRVSGYFSSTISSENKQRFYGITFLLFAILTSISTAIISVYKYDEWQAERWSNILLIISMNVVLWHIVLKGFWDLSARGRKILSRAAFLLFMAPYVSGLVLSDMALWKKICIPIIGFAVGYAIATLESYVSKRVKRRNVTKD